MLVGLVFAVAVDTLTFTYPTREAGNACDDTVRIVRCVHHTASGVCDSTVIDKILSFPFDSDDLRRLEFWGHRRYANSDTLLEVRALTTANAGQVGHVYPTIGDNEVWAYWLRTVDLAGNRSCPSNTITKIGRNVSQVGVGSQPDALEFSIAPSPVRDTGLFRFYLPQPCIVTIDVYGVDGRSEALYSLGQLSAGPHLLTVFAVPRRSGLYFALLRAGDSHRIIKFPVLH